MLPQFTREKDKFQHRLVAHDDTRKEVELAGYRVCPDCLELFSEKEQEQFSLHLKIGDHLSCPRCERKFGSHNRDLYQFHLEFEHCECEELSCPKKCYKRCHPPPDCDCINQVFNLDQRIPIPENLSLVTDCSQILNNIQAANVTNVRRSTRERKAPDRYGF